jgi:hypothetical protein
VRTDLESLLLRKAVGSMTGERSSCAHCGRTPVPGELIHELESGPVLCSLCLASLPERDRATVRSERVHAARRQLAVVPRAAVA